MFTKSVTRGWQMKATHKVLSTKKLQPSLVEKAKEHGIEIIEQEFISVKSIITEDRFKEVVSFADSQQQRKECVVFTSANAVKSFERFVNQGDTCHSYGWKIFCLSGKTLEELSSRYGTLIGEVVGTAENAIALSKLIIRNNVKEIVFFCGNKRRDELPNVLKAAGIDVHEVIVYETVETPVAVIDYIDAILFFSPSAVQSFFSVNQLKKEVVCFAIGETTADSIANFTGNQIITSEFPSQEVMLSAVQLYFKNSNCYG